MTKERLNNLELATLDEPVVEEKTCSGEKSGKIEGCCSCGSDNVKENGHYSYCNECGSYVKLRACELCNGKEIDEKKDKDGNSLYLVCKTCGYEFTLPSCDLCNSNDVREEDYSLICNDCGYRSQRGTPIDFRDRVAYDKQQRKDRSTQLPTSYLSHDKNLGSSIGFGKYYDRRVEKLREARKYAEVTEDREIKEVLKDIAIVADSSRLGLNKKEIESLIVSYRKHFLGKKLSIGRSRFVVDLAFIFLELRKTKEREYLSIDEFIDIIGDKNEAWNEEINKELEKKKDELGNKRNLEIEFRSAISMMAKRHGYKLTQPSLTSVINHVMIMLNLETPMIREAIKLGRLVLPYYKDKSVKFSGLAGAIIQAICFKNGIKMKKKYLIENIHGINSPITIKERMDDFKEILPKILMKRERKLFKLMEILDEMDEKGKVEKGKQMIQKFSSEIDFLNSVLEHVK